MTATLGTMIENLPFTLPALRRAYAEGIRPEAVVEEAFRRLDAAGDPGIFIHQAREEARAEAAALDAPDGRPLWGIPFAVKDNIDVAGMPTTAACADFAFRPAADAFVVSRLRAAGAIVLGKTNLDQFATGLVGTRTPFPVPRNALDPELVPGGSSSGSAVAVARGIAAFALGTDTAGSGRVPAALNGIVGLKPSLGLVSTSGIVPACRTLDAVSIFGLTVDDCRSVLEVAAAFDPSDPWSRRIALPRATATPVGIRIAIPDRASLEGGTDATRAAEFRAVVARLRESGASVFEIDFAPFFAVARMLYEGAWLAERVAAVGSRLSEAPETLHPVTRAVLEPGLRLSAVDAFEGFYRLAALRRDCDEAIAGADLVCVPSIPAAVSLAAIATDPFGPNARLGTWTNFVNLLDLCGIAVPTGSGTGTLPGSVTVLARAGDDARAAGLAGLLEAGPLGATPWTRPPRATVPPQAAADEIAIAVCGAHMSGLPLNHELVSRGARFLRACRTAPAYGLHALAGGPPARPGLVRRASGGTSIELEVWALPRARFGEFIAGVPAPLCIGTVALEDGSSVKGFLCENRGLDGAVDISGLGGWRAFLATREAKRGAAAHA